MKKNTILSLSFVVILCVSYLFYTSYKKSQYIKKAEKVGSLIYEFSDKCTNIVNGYSDVWSGTINNKITYVNGKPVNGDFNTALHYQRELFEAQGAFSTINNLGDSLSHDITELSNPPSDLKDLHEAIINSYSTTYQLYAMAVSPSGTLISYQSRSEQLIYDVIKLQRQVFARVPNN